jgi:hypothetical protein
VNAPAMPTLVVDNAPALPDAGGVAATALGELAADQALAEVRAGASLGTVWLRYQELGAHARRNGVAARAFVLRLARAAVESDH